MKLKEILSNFLLVIIAVDSFVLNDNSTITNDFGSDEVLHITKVNEENAANVFNGVYTECFLYLSYSCLQKKTLLYLKELNKLSEVSVIGEYVKFVKVNESDSEDINSAEHFAKNSEELSFMIDNAVDKFFNSHILKFNALGKDISMTQTVEDFVGRKRKGGGGGGGGGGHGHGGEDGGKKKMMMMAMMCMKMKLMMMVPAMMGMMGMMSFKGMMFSMMSFMISKMMLLMKILEKKGGGGGGGGGDGGWAAGGGGGGGAWMPAGGQDVGGGGGGYDANGQWQSRSILEHDIGSNIETNKPIITYVKPIVRYNNNINKKSSLLKNNNDEVIINQQTKSRKKRGIVDVLQNAYIYWINRVLGVYNKKYYNNKYPKYKLINGVKYVYYPIRQVKVKKPKVLTPTDHIQATTEADVEFKPIITAEDFNRGEIVEGPVESRMSKKKMTSFKDAVNVAMDDNPWQ